MDLVKNLSHRFGERIRMLRREMGLTQEGLAEKAGISPVHLNEIERAKRSPTLRMINRIAQALRVPLWRIFMGMEIRNARPTIEELRFLDLCRTDKPRKGKTPSWRKKYIT